MTCERIHSVRPVGGDKRIDLSAHGGEVSALQAIQCITIYTENNLKNT